MIFSLLTFEYVYASPSESHALKMYPSVLSCVKIDFLCLFDTNQSKSTDPCVGLLFRISIRNRSVAWLNGILSSCRHGNIKVWDPLIFILYRTPSPLMGKLALKSKRTVNISLDLHLSVLDDGFIKSFLSFSQKCFLFFFRLIF